MLATPAAIADVRPDWMTPKTKCSYFLGIRSIVLSSLATSRGPTARDIGTSKTNTIAGSSRRGRGRFRGMMHREGRAILVAEPTVGALAFVVLSDLWSAQSPHPAGDGPPDFISRIFLDVVAPGDLYLGQLWQPADEAEILVVGEDCTGLGPKEQLRHMAR